jgi:hypothetical protein
MNSPYDIHYWSNEYRQEMLHEARTTRLEGWLCEGRKTRSGRRSVSPVLASVLSLVRGA